MVSEKPEKCGPEKNEKKTGFPFFFCPKLDFVPPAKKNSRGKFFLSNGFTLRLHWEKLPKTTIEFLLPTHDAKNREESSTGEFLTTLARLTS